MKRILIALAVFAAVGAMADVASARPRLFGRAQRQKVYPDDSAYGYTSPYYSKAYHLNHDSFYYRDRFDRWQYYHGPGMYYDRNSPFQGSIYSGVRGW
jgi:hypothetical protein